MDAIEIQFCRNRSGFKSLHFEDQMRLMTRYLKEGTMPFEIMTPIQKRDFKKISINYAYDFQQRILMKQVTTKKRKYDANESKKFTPC